MDAAGTSARPSSTMKALERSDSVPTTTSDMVPTTLRQQPRGVRAVPVSNTPRQERALRRVRAAMLEGANVLVQRKMQEEDWHLHASGATAASTPGIPSLRHTAGEEPSASPGSRPTSSRASARLTDSRGGGGGPIAAPPPAPHVSSGRLLCEDCFYLSVLRDAALPPEASLHHNNRPASSGGGGGGGGSAAAPSTTSASTETTSHTNRLQCALLRDLQQQQIEAIVDDIIRSGGGGGGGGSQAGASSASHGAVMQRMSKGNYFCYEHRRERENVLRHIRQVRRDLIQQHQQERQVHQQQQQPQPSSPPPEEQTLQLEPMPAQPPTHHGTPTTTTTRPGKEAAMSSKGKRAHSPPLPSGGSPVGGGGGGGGGEREGPLTLTDPRYEEEKRELQGEMGDVMRRFLLSRSGPNYKLALAAGSSDDFAAFTSPAAASSTEHHYLTYPGPVSGCETVVGAGSVGCGDSWESVYSRDIKRRTYKKWSDRHTEQRFDERKRQQQLAQHAAEGEALKRDDARHARLDNRFLIHITTRGGGDAGSLPSTSPRTERPLGASPLTVGMPPAAADSPKPDRKDSFGDVLGDGDDDDDDAKDPSSKSGRPNATGKPVVVSKREEMRQQKNRTEVAKVLRTDMCSPDDSSRRTPRSPTHRPTSPRTHLYHNYAYLNSKTVFRRRSPQEIKSRSTIPAIASNPHTAQFFVDTVLNKRVREAKRDQDAWEEARRRELDEERQYVQCLRETSAVLLTGHRPPSAAPIDNGDLHAAELERRRQNANFYNISLASGRKVAPTQPLSSSPQKPPPALPSRSPSTILGDRAPTLTGAASDASFGTARRGSANVRGTSPLSDHTASITSPAPRPPRRDPSIVGGTPNPRRGTLAQGGDVTATTPLALKHAPSMAIAPPATPQPVLRGPASATSPASTAGPAVRGRSSSPPADVARNAHAAVALERATNDELIAQSRVLDLTHRAATHDAVAGQQLGLYASLKHADNSRRALVQEGQAQHHQRTDLLREMDSDHVVVKRNMRSHSLNSHRAATERAATARAVALYEARKAVKHSEYYRHVAPPPTDTPSPVKRRKAALQQGRTANTTGPAHGSRAGTAQGKPTQFDGGPISATS